MDRDAQIREYLKAIEALLEPVAPTLDALEDIGGTDDPPVGPGGG